MELIEALQWRYATKKYRDKKVSGDILEKIITAIHLSAYSLGLQPYRVFVIENLKLRKELNVGSVNSQITEASHFIFTFHNAVINSPLKSASYHIDLLFTISFSFFGNI